MGKIRFRDSTGQNRNGILSGEKIMSYGKILDISSVDVLAPTQPTKIIVMDRNHQRACDILGFETPNEPRFYLKTPNTVIGHKNTVRVPASAESIVCEGELAVVIGQDCANVAVDEAESVIEGYTCTNDFIIDDDFVDDPAAVRENNFDCSNPVGPVIVPPNVVNQSQRITLSVNNKIKSETDFSTQLFPTDQIIAEVTKYVTLKRGDIIILGSPMDQFEVAPGDTVEVWIEEIGTLRNYVSRR